MRWLLLKDLRILARSPALVALLALYPLVVAVLIGLALSAGPERPRVAYVSLVDPDAPPLRIGGREVDVGRYESLLFDAIDPVEVDCDGLSEQQCRDAAVAKVESGEAVAALIVPGDFADRLSGLRALTTAGAPTVEVVYDADDPVRARYVEDTINSRLRDANLELTTAFTERGLTYLDMIVSGGTIELPVLDDIHILGLKRAERIVRRARPQVDAATRAQLDRVIRFSRLARENLDFSAPLLRAIREPIRVERTPLHGASSSLSAYAVAVAATFSLMLVALLLAAGALALEREENAFARLVRGLVSRAGLLSEKAALAAVCAGALTLALLAGLELFIDLDWARSPLWLAALALGGLAFGAAGVAVGALARDVRAASLVCVMAALPLAFLALVPSGSVSSGLHDVARAVSAAFPFDPTLSALDAAINGGALLGPLAHLAALTLAFAALARLALRRYD